MADRSPSEAVSVLARAADRLDELADTAELMGDPATARRLRDEARRHRLRAFELLG